MPSKRLAAGAASSKTRVQGGAVEVTIKNAPGILQRIVVANVNAAVQTLTLTDGGTAQMVVRVPAGQTLSLAFGVEFDTSIKVTPSHADVDALVIYD